MAAMALALNTHIIKIVNTLFASTPNADAILKGKTSLTNFDFAFFVIYGRRIISSRPKILS